ncbi:MAG: zf-HC2 domain-containing protein [Acidobacteriota bacterium]
MPDAHAHTDLIEAYLDGELSEADARRIELLEQSDPDFAEELALARRVQSGLRSMAVACPPAVVAAVEARTRRPTWRQRLSRLAAGGPAVGPWRPALATLGAALALLVVSSTQLPRALTPPGAADGGGESAPVASSPAPETVDLASAGVDVTGGVSADEVEAARRDIELAFAYLGQLGRTAESSVRRLRIDPSGGSDAP